ncbi:hypothetical protein HLB23_37220 [Nocardia uniformis]|uniref:Uncharacterized protein n=1 Tax=Nocardia uniformis TaxID=53432 RepID=A0A849CCE7_9NOCA|nr:hypothetical protein [Nocardia uniformis]NNH75428.1 hypothetical protein [Nocardia uniformis]
MSSNEGVWIGGSVRADGSAIAGRDATVIHGSTVGGPPAPATLDELRVALSELLTQVRAAEELPEREEVAATVEQARAEAAKERPNRHLLGAFLDAAGRAVAGIGALTALVTTLRGAADTILGG